MVNFLLKLIFLFALLVNATIFFVRYRKLGEGRNLWFALFFLSLHLIDCVILIRSHMIDDTLRGLFFLLESVLICGAFGFFVALTKKHRRFLFLVLGVIALGSLYGYYFMKTQALL